MHNYYGGTSPQIVLKTVQLFLTSIDMLTPTYSSGSRTMARVKSEYSNAKQS